MKPLLQIIINLGILFHYFVGTLFLLFWYGKLNKVSPYHGYTNKNRTPMKPSDWMNENFQMESQILAKKDKTNESI